VPSSDWGADRAHVGKLIRKHDGRVAYFKFRVADPAIGHRDAFNLSCVERLLVKFNRLGGVLADQIRNGASEAVGNRLRFHVFWFGTRFQLFTKEKRPDTTPASLQQHF
jgi:hypothetical protein